MVIFKSIVVKRVCSVLERVRCYRLRKNKLRGETAGTFPFSVYK